MSTFEPEQPGNPNAGGKVRDDTAEHLADDTAMPEETFDDDDAGVRHRPAPTLLPPD